MKYVDYAISMDVVITQNDSRKWNRGDIGSSR